MKRHSEKIKQQCFQKYLETGSVEQSAQSLNIPLNTVLSWHRREKWSEKLKENAQSMHIEIQNMVVEDKAQKEFDVRKELVNACKFIIEMVGLNPTVEIEKELKPSEIAMLLNVLSKKCFLIAKIDGLITDKQELQHKGLGQFADAIATLHTIRQEGNAQDHPYLRLLQGKET